MQISGLSIKMNTYKICLTIDIFDINNFSLFLNFHFEAVDSLKFFSLYLHLSSYKSFKAVVDTSLINAC